MRSRSIRKIITRILHSDSGHNTIFDLDVTGSGTVKAMIVDWQHEPIKGELLHIDLKRIAMDKAMRVSVPIQLIGVPVGVKTQGGILEHVLREVEIECLPARYSEPPGCGCQRPGDEQVDSRLRPAALGLDQVPDRRRRDRRARHRDPRRGCWSPRQWMPPRLRRNRKSPRRARARREAAPRRAADAKADAKDEKGKK